MTVDMTANVGVDMTANVGVDMTANVGVDVTATQTDASRAATKIQAAWRGSRVRRRRRAAEIREFLFEKKVGTVLEMVRRVTLLVRKVRSRCNKPLRCPLAAVTVIPVTREAYWSVPDIFSDPFDVVGEDDINAIDYWYATDDTWPHPIIRPGLIFKPNMGRENARVHADAIRALDPDEYRRLLPEWAVHFGPEPERAVRRDDVILRVDGARVQARLDDHMVFETDHVVAVVVDTRLTDEMRARWEARQEHAEHMKAIQSGAGDG